MENPNIVQLTAVPQPLGTVPAPAAGAPRNSADIRAMAQALLNMIAGAVLTTTPTGMVTAFAGVAAPDGWLLCDGRAVSRTAYPTLYAVLGTRHGAGDGATTFNLPDLRGRTLLGAGQGANLTNRQLATVGGAETHALTLAEMPNHTHSAATPKSPAVPVGSGGLYELPTPFAQAAYPDFDYVGAAPTSAQGANGAHNNMPPFMALNYIIRS